MKVATIFTAGIPPKGEKPVREQTRYVGGLEDAETFYKRLYVEALKRKRMRYGYFRRKGYFIGSGVTESSCKHLVGTRLKRAGMNWDKQQAQAILQLRLARLNDRWDCLWN